MAAPYEILSAEARTKQRDQAAAELVRGLLLINGGGAAALLAFLNVIWSSNRSLVKPTIVGLVILAFGAVLAAAFHLIRYEASMAFQFADERSHRGPTLSVLYRVLAGLSAIAFVAGVLVVAVGAWLAAGR